MFTNVRGECQDFAGLEVLFWNFRFCNQGLRLANKWRHSWRKRNRKSNSLSEKKKFYLIY